jgi:hypothetical protein
LYHTFLHVHDLLDERPSWSLEVPFLPELGLVLEKVLREDRPAYRIMLEILPHHDADFEPVPEHGLHGYVTVVKVKRSHRVVEAKPSLDCVLGKDYA